MSSSTKQRPVCRGTVMATGLWHRSIQVLLSSRALAGGLRTKQGLHMAGTNDFQQRVPRDDGWHSTVRCPDRLRRRKFLAQKMDAMLRSPVIIFVQFTVTPLTCTRRAQTAVSSCHCFSKASREIGSASIPRLRIFSTTRGCSSTCALACARR